MNEIIVSWDFKASSKEIAEKLNDALEEAGSEMRFEDMTERGSDTIELRIEE